MLGQGQLPALNRSGDTTAMDDMELPDHAIPLNLPVLLLAKLGYTLQRLLVAPAQCYELEDLTEPQLMIGRCEHMMVFAP